VKRYTSDKKRATEEESWEHARVRLEPLNREFESFELGPDEFRVVAEFVEVLGPASS
jgi:SOS-response transcriptional repressor LexA